MAAATPETERTGSKYPMFKASGPTSHQGYGVWNQEPQLSGTKTVRGLFKEWQ